MKKILKNQKEYIALCKFFYLIKIIHNKKQWF